MVSLILSSMSVLAAAAPSAARLGLDLNGVQPAVFERGVDCRIDHAMLVDERHPPETARDDPHVVVVVRAAPVDRLDNGIGKLCPDQRCDVLRGDHRSTILHARPDCSPTPCPAQSSPSMPDRIMPI